MQNDKQKERPTYRQKKTDRQPDSLPWNGGSNGGEEGTEQGAGAVVILYLIQGSLKKTKEAKYRERYTYIERERETYRIRYR